jgi:hypothetical protein
MFWPWQQFEVVQRLLAQIQASLNHINAKLDLLVAREAKAMATLDDIKAAVTNETTVIGSVSTLITQLVAAAKAAAPSDATELQSILDEITANTNALSDAVAANTPQPAPAVAPAPTPAPAPAV